MVGNIPGAAQMSRGIGSNLGSILTNEQRDIGFAVHWTKLGIEVSFDRWPQPGEPVYAHTPANCALRSSGNMIAISADLTSSSRIPIGTFVLHGQRLEMTLHSVPGAKGTRVFAEV